MDRRDFIKGASTAGAVTSAFAAARPGADNDYVVMSVGHKLSRSEQSCDCSKLVCLFRDLDLPGRFASPGVHFSELAIEDTASDPGVVELGAKDRLHSSRPYENFSGREHRRRRCGEGRRGCRPPRLPEVSGVPLDRARQESCRPLACRSDRPQGGDRGELRLFACHEAGRHRLEPRDA